MSDLDVGAYDNYLLNRYLSEQEEGERMMERFVDKWGIHADDALDEFKEFENMDEDECVAKWGDKWEKAGEIIEERAGDAKDVYNGEFYG